jgi:formiminotetrahydrofolate cyclodeaminase
MTAIRMPKETEDQMAVRKSSIASAMLQATEIPLANAEGCQQALDLCSRLQDRSNPNAVSDLECAGQLALAGLKGCLANVAINLPSLKDQAGAEQIKARAQELQQFVNSL